MDKPRTITKKELVDRIADQTGAKHVLVKKVVQGFLDEIIEELSKDNRLEFRDFGVFEVKFRKARRAQNPRTLEKVNVPPKKVVKFKVGRVMREKVGDAAAVPGAGTADTPATPPVSPPMTDPTPSSEAGPFGGTGTDNPGP